MTISEEKLNREVSSNFNPFLLLNFENFWASTQWATLGTSTTQFSACFEHFCHLNFLSLLEESSAEVFNTKPIANLIQHRSCKFGNLCTSKSSLRTKPLAGCPL
jgi:hypothetical protein